MTLLTIGTVIGSGIFLVPGGVLRQVQGSVGLALLVWAGGGVLSLLGALTYAELGAMRPASGGLYVYIRDCFGELAAFLFGWTLFFVISTGTVATLAVAFSTYLQEVLPLAALARKLVSVGMIVVMTAINVRGTRLSADVTNWSTALKVGAIVLMSGVLLVLSRGWQSDGPVWPEVMDSSLFSGFGLGMIAVLWAYEGWQYPTYSAGEIREPERIFARGLLLGTVALIGIYLLANVAYLAALGPTEVARSESVAAVSLAAVVGPWAAKLVALAILVSIFSAANSTALTAPRVFYAMAADGVFFRALARIHSRFQTPALAIVAGSAWAVVLVLWMEKFEKLLTYVVFIGWTFYALAAASVFVYRLRQPDLSRPYRVPGYPLTPLLFILASLAVVLNNIWTQPGDSAKGLAVVLAGLPAYMLWRRANGDKRAGRRTG